MKIIRERIEGYVAKFHCTKEELDKAYMIGLIFNCSFSPTPVQQKKNEFTAWIDKPMNYSIGFVKMSDGSWKNAR